MKAKTSFILRTSEGLHRSLTAQAAEKGVSFNEWCTRKLMGSAYGSFDAQLPVQIEKIRSFFPSGDLVGILLYGSYARRE